MRKCLILALMLLAMSVPALAETTTTVLLYVSGSDLESEDGSAWSDFAEAAYADPSGPVTVLAMTGGCEDWWDEVIPEDVLTIHRITGEGLDTLETLPQASMGSADTLAQFITYGMREATADRYVLVLWGHGDGPAGGVCGDPLFDEDYLMPDELKAALEGVHLDAVIFDSCLMASVEYAQALSGSADYMVASQESTVGTGMRYDRWLGVLMGNPNLDTRALCEAVAQTYVQNNDHGRFGEMCTISVLDLSCTEAVTEAVEALYAQLGESLTAQPETVLERRATITAYGGYEDGLSGDLVDALLVAEAFGDVAPEACAALREALSRMVVFNDVTQDMMGLANGLSLTMPYEGGGWTEPIYDLYSPLAEESDYAALIVRMAELAEARYESEYSFMGELWSNFKKLEAAVRNGVEVPDAEDMWEGLQ